MKRRALAALVAVLVVGAVPLPHALPAGAEGVVNASSAKDRQREIGKELAALEDHLDEAVAEESSLLAEYEAAKARVDELHASVAALGAQVAEANRALAAAQASLDEAEARYQVTVVELDRTRRELRRAHDELEARAVTAYTGGRGSPLSMAEAVLRAENLAQVNASFTYLHAVMEDQQQEVDRHEALERKAERLADEAAETRSRALALRDETDRRRREVAAAEAAQRQALAEAAAEAAKEEGLLAQARSKRAEVEGRIASLRAESDSIADFLRRRQTGQPVSLGTGTGALSSPLPGARITSLYGPRVHPIYGTTRMHNGIDMAGPTGRPIRAAAAGEVIFAGVRGGYGNVTIIDHGGALATLYAHQSELAAPVGATVAAGEVIGYVGSTGFSTGPHLHFEVRVAGNPVDPLRYL